MGAFVGEIHAAIGIALHCVGCVTNGAVRDLPAVEAMGFQLYARHTSVSHAYAHIIEFGEPVEIDGLKISSGDLLHGDRHGVLTIPIAIAGQVPRKGVQNTRGGTRTDRILPLAALLAAGVVGAHAEYESKLRSALAAALKVP